MNQLQFSATFINKTEQAIKYYKSISPSLAKRFYNALELDLEKIRNRPNHFGYLAIDKSKTIRRLNQKKFPNVIMFEVNGSIITILNLHNLY